MTTNIDKIYKNRDEALEKLYQLSCGFGETILIRYYSETNPTIHDCFCHPHRRFINIIQALYKSENTGDFVIIMDSGAEKGSSVYQGVISEGDTIQDSIAGALFGDCPQDGNIVVLTDPKTKEVQSYVYCKDEWIFLGKKDTREIYYPDPNQFEVKDKNFKIKTVWGGTFKGN